MKKVIVILVAILQIFLLSGCSSDPFIVFSAQNPKSGLNKNQIEYNFKIDNITRELKAVALQIDTIKRYVQAIGDDANPAVAQIKATKKERN